MQLRLDGFQCHEPASSRATSAKEQRIAMHIVDLDGRRRQIMKVHRGVWKIRVGCFAALLLTAMVLGCSKPETPAEGALPPIKKIPAGAEFSGFLKDYNALKPNPDVDSEMLTYVSTDA